MDNSTLPRGPGLFEISHANGERHVTNVRRLAGAERPPGAALIAAAAWLLTLIGAGALYVSFSAQRQYVFAARHQDVASIIEALLLDLLMIVFTLLALGLSRAGRSSRTERALILACAIASAYMNVSAADTASPRSVVAYAVAPIALAVVVDRVVAVIRRHVLGDAEASAWTAPGRAVVAVARLAGLVLLYSLRLCLAAPETARGLRRVVLDAAPLPQASRSAPGVPDGKPGLTPPDRPQFLRGESKTARFLALVHEHYGELAAIDPAKVSRICTDLAPEVGLNAGAARSALLPRVRAAQNTTQNGGAS
jgi:Protein of unknown function (DUF2637)